MNGKQNRKKVIGLTGKYCAGKNYAAGILESLGFPVLDVDVLGHKIIEMEKSRLLARFGRDILGQDGLVDRKMLGAKVFGRKEELKELEGIIHPAVNRKTIAWINERPEKACFVNAALLHRSSAFSSLDAIILVEAPLFLRLLRAKKRDRLSWGAITKRFRSQGEFYAQYFRKKTDIYRVENSGFPWSKPESRINEILSLLGIT